MRLLARLSASEELVAVAIKSFLQNTVGALRFGFVVAAILVALLTNPISPACGYSNRRIAFALRWEFVKPATRTFKHSSAGIYLISKG
jgi:hypothetical protein